MCYNSAMLYLTRTFIGNRSWREISFTEYCDLQAYLDEEPGTAALLELQLVAVDRAEACASLLESLVNPSSGFQNI
jgi:hypothetical protein